MSSLQRAGQWLLKSGIQERSGGVARYYLSETGANKPVSTEITGYAASAFAYLYRKTGDASYLDAARRAAAFLAQTAWDGALSLFPFEHPSPSPVSNHHAYFFDTGIIVRGLMAVWRLTHDEELLKLSVTASRAMRLAFFSGSDYDPILILPAKTPLARGPQWSRGPGCYQLKAALAWRDTGAETGDADLTAAYLELVSEALQSHREFIRLCSDPYKTMDRLHAYSYFVEALIPVLDDSGARTACAHAIDAIADELRRIAPLFARSDVYAQLLRARLYAEPFIGIDETAAAEEAGALTEFQMASDDIRIDGGFVFGRRDGALSPHVNPVSTTFALQALEMWRARESGESRTGSGLPCYNDLI